MNTIKNQLVRVGVMNNFNYTDEELQAIKHLDNKFVNCHIGVFTKFKNVLKLKKHGIQTVITLNPNLNLNEYMAIFHILKDINHVTFRIKITIKNYIDVKRFIKKYPNVKFLITFMRFFKKETLLSNCRLMHGYSYRKGYYRMGIKNKKVIQEMYSHIKGKIYFCDVEESGCTNCNNCQRVTGYNPDHYEVYSLSLIESGICPYNCPDCFAKKLNKLCKNTSINSVIKKNRKQKGVQK